MRVLLDECVPRRLGRGLVGHDVRTVAQEGWSGKKNGELLGLMLRAGFDVLITVDQGIPHQQKLKFSGIAGILLFAESNQLHDLMPLVSEILAALSSLQPGEVVEVRS